MRILLAIKSDLRVIQRIQFQLHKALYFWSLSKEIKKQKETVFWLRDITLAKKLTHLRSDQKIILELHSNLSKSDWRALEQISKSCSLILAPISPNLLKEVESRRLTGKVVFSPMGVDPERFSHAQEVMNIRPQVLYLGHFTSVGQSNGLETVIKAAQIAQDEERSFQFVLSGGSPADLEYYSDYAERLKLSQEYLRFQGHVAFDSVAQVLGTADCLIVPYPNNPQFWSSWPLKLLEYALSKRPQIVANSEFLKTIVNETFVTFFESDNPSDLVRAIDFVINPKNRSTIEHRTQNSWLWASQFTWENRTKTILQNL
jgi:glycosyltransferase involved in cell wall biosynthesis